MTKPPAMPADGPFDASGASVDELEDLSKEELLAVVKAQREAGVRISFAGKANARRLARKVRPRVQREIKKYSAGSPEEQARNLLVEGDNLQSLVTLYKERNQIDLIVADPPYNTGNDFRYNDKWEEDPNHPGLGEFISPEDTARHTKWMRFMWPRLQMMKSMLKPRGVLAICIDHRELFHLGQMLDELFGEANRLAIINWQRSYSRASDTKHVAVTTEYVLVYARDEKKATTGLLPKPEADEEHQNLDADPEDWVDGPATASDAKGHQPMVYGVQSPFTGDTLYPPEGSHWRLGQSAILEALEGWNCGFTLKDIGDAEKRAALIGVPVDEVAAAKAIVLTQPLEDAQVKAREIYENGVWPKFYFLKKGQGRPRLKNYVAEMQAGFVPTTFWASEDLGPVGLGSVSWKHAASGHSQQGVEELTAIVGKGHDFKTVKPLKLFSKIIQIWCPESGTVADPFAGTGTTGHATLALNAETGASRRFILIEQGRPEKGDSYARTLMADRMARVVSGKWASGDCEPLPGGFRFVKLDKKVDAAQLLHMEREEMVDTVIASHFDANQRRGQGLVTVTGAEYRYLVARNADDEGFYLVWDGVGQNTDLGEEVYEACAAEARDAGLKPIYHIYARFNYWQSDNIRFYQIPDRILADFGLDVKSEPFAEPDE